MKVQGLYALLSPAKPRDRSYAEHPDPPSPELEERIRTEILERVAKVEEEETECVSNIIDDVFADWKWLPPDIWGTFNPDEEDVPFMFPSGFHPHIAWDD